MASMASWYVCILPVCAISVPTVAVSFLWMSSEILSVFIFLSSLSQVASSGLTYNKLTNFNKPCTKWLEKSIWKVLFSLTHLSPPGESVVPATDFYKVKDNYKVKDKAQFLHGGCPELVRIQCRVSRKRYLNSKRIYEYERVSLYIPRKYHELIKPFLNQDFDVSVATEKDIIVITLTPQKTVQQVERSS